MLRQLFSQLKSLYHRHRQILLYLFFGGCTTVVNIVCFWLAERVAGCSTALSTTLAWLAAVIFAFFTNKRYVFQSHCTTPGQRLGELLSFFGCRIATGVMDVIIMVVTVDLMGWNSMLWKIISNVLVTVANYVASKFFIFRRR